MNAREVRDALPASPVSMSFPAEMTALLGELDKAAAPKPARGEAPGGAAPGKADKRG